ncbi:DUF3574 domain-containing protein [Hyalangium minutum]|uniref:DUF3574 domain-containing protein n=1 Tax=Hyalangium minutum TaxID=394096 RepID=UPI0005C45BDC|nr:DUF3574 domain-containing protein [Hyalangium minutum]
MTLARLAPPSSAVLRNLLLVMTLGALTSACGGESCDVGSEMYRTELFFGLDRENTTSVSEAEWQNFVDTTVTPRFSSGLTMFDANGQYLMDNGNLIHEDSKVIVLLHDGSDAISNSIDTIREEYKSRFSQEAVLRVDSVSCVAF